MKVKAFFSFIVLVFVLMLLSGFLLTLHVTEYEIKVTDTVVKQDDGDSKYLVYAEINGETKVFENTDELFKLKFDSSDIQANLKVGETYKVKACGFRIKILSKYENIYEIIE